MAVVVTQGKREAYDAWLAERLREEDIERREAARRKNGWWRNFWTDFGGDLLLVACVLGGSFALVLIYLAVETAGWFNL